MPDIVQLIQQGTTNIWLFIPTAILLGALHGLEPGHSKTMMASFIIAIRGTVAQAALLGLCAAFSHSLIVWLLAVIALKFGTQMIAEQAEPYFMMASAVVVLVVAAWMLYRTYRDNHAANMAAPHGGQLIHTGHGAVELEMEESSGMAYFRLYSYDDHLTAQAWNPDSTVNLHILRADGSTQQFTLQLQGEYLQSLESIPEPHEFTVSLTIKHGDHAHAYELKFSEECHEHNHAHAHSNDHGHRHDHHGSGEYQDAHERAHALEIEQRFAGRQVSTAQIALFGLTGGLMPCPASVTILMICLQLKRFTLGLTMVASFSLGLAVSLVSVGMLAAWGAQQVGKRFTGLGNMARKMPYLSSGLMVVVAIIMGLQGLGQVLK